MIHVHVILFMLHFCLLLRRLREYYTYIHDMYMYSSNICDVYCLVNNLTCMCWYFIKYFRSELLLTDPCHHKSRHYFQIKIEKLNFFGRRMNKSSFNLGLCVISYQRVYLILYMNEALSDSTQSFCKRWVWSELFATSQS